MSTEHSIKSLRTTDGRPAVITPDLLGGVNIVVLGRHATEPPRPSQSARRKPAK